MYRHTTTATKATIRYYTNIRNYTTQSKFPIGFVFDIDGVLMQSKNPILPFASNTLHMLRTNNIPFTLLTNGGGQSESKRTAALNTALAPITSLTHLLAVTPNAHDLITPDQLIQSHTPLRDLRHKYKRVLVVGGADPQAREAVQEYGFGEVLRPIDLLRSHPLSCPYSSSRFDNTEYALPPTTSLLDTKPIDAVFVINDSRDMAVDMQVVIDALLSSENGIITTRRRTGGNSSLEPSIPVYWSNADMQWSTGYDIPRLGLGAFREAVRAVYAGINNGRVLNDHTWGKPEKISYQYAEESLRNECGKISGVIEPKLYEGTPDKVYMVGDNPASDIRGGNNYGWETILVKTGVYQDGDFVSDKTLARPTLGVYDNVWDGVCDALVKNNIEVKF